MLSNLLRLGPAGGTLVFFCCGSVAALETQSYAIDWFSQASYSTDGDCPGGVSPPWDVQYVEDLKALGYSGVALGDLVKQYQEGGQGRSKVYHILGERGRIDGKPVNAFAHPAAVVDPKLKAVTGRYAYGFNLDGKGADSADTFEDPETHERGVDNQVFRAVGCMEQMRGNSGSRPTFWDFIWNAMRIGGNPATLITVSGEHLDRDGPVTITFDRSLDHLVLVGANLAVHDATYRIDPDPRSHYVFEGQIKDGVISITRPGYLKLRQDPLAHPELVLQQTHMRLRLNPDGSGVGYLGGYQPWRDYYYGIGHGGLNYEGNIIGDQPGIFYAVRRLADADPDPVTGENRAISVTYRIDVVPAFAVKAERGSFNNAVAR